MIEPTTFPSPRLAPESFPQSVSTGSTVSRTGQFIEPITAELQLLPPSFLTTRSALASRPSPRPGRRRLSLSCGGSLRVLLLDRVSFRSRRHPPSVPRSLFGHLQSHRCRDTPARPFLARRTAAIPPRQGHSVPPCAHPSRELANGAARLRQFPLSATGDDLQSRGSSWRPPPAPVWLE